MRPAALIAVLVLVALGVLALLTWSGGDRPAGKGTTQARPDARLASPAPDPGPVDLGVEPVAGAPLADVRTVVVGPTLLRVRVTAREDARPLGHVRVKAWREAGTAVSSEQAIETDPLGWGEFEVEPGVSLRVAAQSDRPSVDGETIDVAPLTPGEVREVHLSIATQDGRTAIVRVLDRETREPIRGAHVGPAEQGFRVPGRRAVRTDEAGTARLPIASWSSPDPAPILGIQAEGYEPAAFRPAPHPDAQDFEIRLSRTATLRVRVLDGSGAPVAGASVEALTEAYRFAQPEGTYLRLGMDPVWRAQTDPQGLVLLRDLPPRMPLRAGAYDGRVVLWQAREPLVLEPGELRELTWQTGRGAQLRGVVIERDGAVARGVELWFVPAWHDSDRFFESHGIKGLRKVRSDAVGCFTIDDVDAGSWWLGPAPSGTPFGPERDVGPDDVAPIGRHVVVPAGVQEVAVEIRLSRGLAIRGRVVGPDGEPVPAALVWAQPVGGGATVLCQMNDEEGRFVLGPLAPGVHEIHADAMFRFVRSAPVLADCGEQDVLLRLQRGGLLRGRVVEAGTGAPRPANLIVRPQTPGALDVRMQSSDAQGAFEVDGLPTDTYDLGATTSDGRAGLLRNLVVRAGEERADLVLEVRPGARLDFRFRGPHPLARLEVLADGVLVQVDGVEKGTGRMLVVPAGPVALRLSIGKLSLAETLLELAVGETREITYDDGWR